MKAQTSIILSISQGCHESWNDMTPADKGRFCQHCQQTVTDFSALSDAQLIELLKSKKASACGRFTADQLNRAIYAPVPEKRHKPYISIAAVVAALSIAIPSVKAAVFTAKTEQTADGKQKRATYDITSENPVGFISGVIKTDKDHLPLPGATIKIKDRNVGAVTDEEGNFKLRIPPDFKEKVLILEVSFIGYAKKHVKVVLRKNSKPLDIMLKEDTTVLGGYGIHFITDNKQEPSIWKKFTGAVRGILS